MFRYYPFEELFAERRVTKLVELGTLLANMINLIPDGVVMFLPSYSFLNQLQEVWKQNGTLQRIDAKKKVRQSLNAH